MIQTRNKVHSVLVCYYFISYVLHRIIFLLPKYITISNYISIFTHDFSRAFVVNLEAHSATPRFVELLIDWWEFLLMIVV